MGRVRLNNRWVVSSPGLGFALGLDLGLCPSLAYAPNCGMRPSISLGLALGNCLLAVFAQPAARSRSRSLSIASRL